MEPEKNILQPLVKPRKTKCVVFILMEYFKQNRFDVDNKKWIVKVKSRAFRHLHLSEFNVKDNEDANNVISFAQFQGALCTGDVINPSKENVTKFKFLSLLTLFFMKEIARSSATLPLFSIRQMFL